jgi:hypothetical protein
MRVTLVASHPDAACRWDDASSPAHLADDLADALRAAGHDVAVDRLPDVPEAPHAYAEAAAAGRRLAERVSSLSSPPDVLHALDPAAALVSLAARSLTATPVVMRSGPMPDPPGAVERRLRLAALRAADVVVAPTSLSARRAAAGGAGQVRVVPDAVDARALTAVARRSCADTGGRPRLVTLTGGGGGLHVLLKALRAVPDVELIVAGHAREDGATGLTSSAARLGVAERVRWAGWLDRDEALGLAATAAAVVCPRLAPTSGTSALEAMALGRAVVAADVPGPGDLVAHRTTGLLVRPGDQDALAAALRAVLSDPFRCEAWGEAGRDRVSASFDWERKIRLLELAYTDAVRAGAAPLHAHHGATSATVDAAIA